MTTNVIRAAPSTEPTMAPASVPAEKCELEPVAGLELAAGAELVAVIELTAAVEVTAGGELTAEVVLIAGALLALVGVGWVVVEVGVGVEVEDGVVDELTDGEGIIDGDVDAVDVL